ncbi:fatty acid synthase alpha subunit Lsd1 [Coemansia sp. RSA 552]|nr:fatty acid synthase alpha subunit Lsd1 [Coemansia sp. RSA 552]
MPIGVSTAAVFSMLSDEDSFEKNSRSLLAIMMTIGAIAQLQYPYDMDVNDTDASLASARPMPMVHIRGVTRDRLVMLLAEFNSQEQNTSRHVHLAVTNTSDQFIVAGIMTSAVKLVKFVSSHSASPEEDQSKVPFSQRRPVISTSYLGITAPYHCSLLEDAAQEIYQYAQEKGWVFDAGNIRLPVHGCDDGHDIRTEETLTQYLIQSMCVVPVDWPVAISAPDVTHIVHFGMGGFSGFGQLVHRNVEGRGIPVICAGALVPQSSHATLGTKGNLYQRQLCDVISAPNWLEMFGPRLVRTAHDGQVHIDTRMRRTLGAPTVMVAGMTPTTTNSEFVAAINNAGYHAELAGGGINTEPDLERTIKALAKSVEPGQGITLNCIYVSPRQWSFQFPTILRLRSEGFPIVGLCIGGGVPSFDVALEIISSLREAGIRHVLFKPSTAEAIRHVVKVAQASDGFPIVLQWTGGRAGGHHSYEDFHQPILETYAAIRACDNVALVAGSGFGDAEGALPYITGDWSVEFGRAPMPFDGVLLGSRVMVAQEAGTSSAVKELIVAAQGLPDSDWQKTYCGTDGGVISFTTEFGELNHSLATRATVFLRDMHKTVLNQPREKREALLLARKDEVIARLNCDYMRPWFGRKADGRVVDLEYMTYAEVIDRLVELMYVKHQQRWVHPSYLQFVSNFISRSESRMVNLAPDSPIITYLGNDPCEFAKEFAQEYPQVAVDLLASEDIQFFIYMCKRRDQKPVPFIPVLDADFGTLLQKDTTWQSEDLDAVVEQDSQRVCIQQGAVAARYSTVVDEPVKEILDGIYQQHIKALIHRLYDGDESKVPVVEYIGNDPAVVTLSAAVQVSECDPEHVFYLPANSKLLPKLDMWLQAVAGPQKSWLWALLTFPVLVQGSTYTSNYVCNLMRPRPGRIVAVNYKDAVPDTLVISDASGVVELDIACDDNRAICLTIHHQISAGTTLSLQLEFDYCPSFSLTPIYERKQKNDKAMQQFYISIWLARAGPNATYADITDSFEMQRENFIVDMEHTRAYCRSVNAKSWHYIHGTDGIPKTPMDYLHTTSSQSMLRILQSTVVGLGLTRLVHLRNRMGLADGASMCQHGDIISATAQITKLVNGQAGKIATVHFAYHVRGQQIGFMESDFLFRGHFVDTDRTFERTHKKKIVVCIPSPVEVRSLEARDWFVYLEDSAARLEPGTLVEFCLDSEYHFANDKVYSHVEIMGSVHIVKPTGQRIHIANIDYMWNTSTGNPVILYLAWYQVDTNKNLFDGGGYPLVNSTNEHLAQARVPHSNHAYARISGDYNPIHIDPFIADLAGLPGTITHGLWTNGCSRAALERVVAAGHPERIRSFQVDFTDTLLPKDRLTHEFFHVGMKDGRMLIDGQTSRVGGSSVMSISAEVDQPLTAYIFTGQGSQKAGMGMDLYQQSPAAQAVWEKADLHMLEMYGISLLNIVRANPAEHTVYFNGKAGKAIRDSYRSMAKQAENDASGQHPLLPGMSDKAMSYTFRSPTGLLNSTQFTQAALVTAAMASVADLRSQGLVQKHALWGGHSLGEFAALAALGQVFSVKDTLDVVFVRGLIMQSTVPRDAHGRSEYGMAAVNPSRVGPAFGEDMLRQVVDEIATAGTGLLQVVNYNVQGQQYVVAGTLASLEVLRLVLDGFAEDGVPAADAIAPYIKQATCTVLESPARISPARGTAAIPLDGIDVPFHSQLLLGGVDALRKTLRAKLAPGLGAPLDALCGRYIPNLTATPFEVTEEYFRQVFRATQSPVVRKVLRSWSAAALDDPAQKERLALLLLIELLAYQLASPVQWIKTQEYIIGRANVQRLVEIGPSPVLCGMATKMLQSHAFSVASVEVLHIERDYDRVYYQYSPDQTIAKVADELLPNDSSDPRPPEQPVPAPVAALPEKGSTGTALPLADTPLPALNVVHAVVAFKLKQSLDDTSTQKSIKALAGGKSILQNEIVGDLQKEFGNSIPDKPEDMALQELGSGIGSAGSLGKCTQPLVARMFSSKMPGGFSLSSARSILETAYGLGPKRQDALLLVALTMEPSSRLGSTTEATAWLDKVAQAYAADSGISYSQMAESAISSAQGKEPVVSSAEMKKVQKQQYQHARHQIEVLARYAGIDLRKEGRLAETQQAISAELQSKVDAMEAELGSDFAEGIMPCFDARQARHFDSYWNWARQDAYEWIQQAIGDCASGLPVKVDRERVHRLQIRADQELLQLLSGTAQILGSENNPALAPVLELCHRLHDACKLAIDSPATYLELSTSCQPHTHISQEGEVTYTEIPRSDEPTFAEYVQHMRCDSTLGDRPPLHLCDKASYQRWDYSESLSDEYFDSLSQLCSQGVSFAGMSALVTGCGRGSIGAEVIRGLLMGGAKVLATTSSYSRRTTLFFEDMYRQYGARSAELILVPFNQGSVQDIEALVNYIFGQPGSDQGGLGWNLDYVVPFGAVSDIGSSVSNLGSHSELAQRVLLTNTFRLMGCIKSAKEAHRYKDRPSLVVLPMSPNHGTMGGDGFYGECKIGLETAFNRWESESWRGYLSIASAVIGWTRGTGLMSGSNLVAMEVERSGIRTFSAREMAFNVLGLLHPQISGMAHWSPVWAVLDSGMGQADSFAELVAREKSRIEITSKQHQDVSLNAAAGYSDTYGHRAQVVAGSIKSAIPILAKHQHHFPAPTSYDSLEHLHHLQDMVNLDKVVVITGYGEVSPHGNAETRWEIEAFGQLSTESCIELAWIMGLIKHHNGQLSAAGEHYIGWVDSAGGEPVKDIDIKTTYEEYILAHTGIRLIEPELVGGYDPNWKQVMREIQIQHDMEPFEASAEDAAAYKKNNGDKVDACENTDGSWSVRFLKGALIRVPAAASATRLVAGLLPTGWSARRFGIPEDVINQVDPVTLYTLVAVMEALVRSGITDPYQLYQHFHVSEIGSTIGSGVGGGIALQDVFIRRKNDEDIKNDALQETFISTIQAWVNMLLMSGAGPVKPAVGACATALLSVDTAVETIQSGKAKVMLAGGADVFFEEGSTEFANMGATSNSVDELANGRTPGEMSRPWTSSRSGFIEGQGAGAVVLMSAAAAIKCGAPIYGVVGMTMTATDKQGRSVSAPGKGILSTAREIEGPMESRLLDLDYRQRKLQRQLQTLDSWKQDELDALQAEAAKDGLTPTQISYRKANIEDEYLQQKGALQDICGNEFWKRDQSISPLRGSLAVWGLTVDDIGLASFHGTSTKANDTNESEVLNAQMVHLGRTPGHVLPAVSQKWLTGHPKGAAAAFMLNGVLQSLRTGIIPGNRNADNIGQDLQHCDHLLYLSQAIHTSGIKAGLLKSFGFGQVGGEMLVIHPDYILATLSQEQLEVYNQKLQKSVAKGDRYFQDALVGNHSFVQVKSSLPYTTEQEQEVLLDPRARARFNPATRKYQF